MDESNSLMDQSSYADPNEPVLRVILHTSQNTQFSEYVNGRQKAFEKAAKILCWMSDGLNVLMEEFEQSVYNGTPLGQIKRRTHNLIDNGSLEVVELLQIPSDRNDSKEETGTATHLPPDRPTLLEDSDYEPPENKIEGYVDDYVQNCNDADEWEPVAVVQRTKKAVFNDSLKQSQKFAGNTEVQNSEHDPKLTMQIDAKTEPLLVTQLPDQEPPLRDVKLVLDYASDQEDLIDDEPRAEFPLDYDMNWRIVNFFIVPLSYIKSSPPFTPALSEYLNHIKTSRAGGLRVDVRQYLSQRIKSNTDPEKSAYYKTLQKYGNTPMISSFVLFMCNKWKTGKTLKSKENAFLKELNQWIDSVWSMERTKYLARRRRGICPNWLQETCLQFGGGPGAPIELQPLPKAKEKTKDGNPVMVVDCLFENDGQKAYISNFLIDHYLKQLAENNPEAEVLPSVCFQEFNASLIEELIGVAMEKNDVKFIVSAYCYQQHWRILKIDSKAIYEYDALNLPIPAKIEAVITELRKSKSLGFRRLSEDPSKPKQRDGHNCGLFVIGQAIEWMSNKPWRAETLPSMPEFRMDVLEKLMATCLCTLNNCPVTISTVFAHRQQMNMNRGSSVCSFEQKKMNSRDAPLSQHIDQLYNTNAPDEMHTNERSSHQRKRTSSDARKHVETKIVTSSTPTKRGCEIDLEIRDISILISAENGNGLRVKIREPNSSANTKSEGICDFHENSMKWTSGDAGTQSSSKRDVVFHPEYVDQFNNSNALTLPQSPILQTNAESSPPRKMNSPENEAPAAKKSKIETVFVIHGLFQRNRPIDNRPFIEFLSSQGFKINSECDILPNVSLPTRQPKPKFLANFSAVGQTKEDLSNWLNEESTIVHFYSGNREQFGSDACKYLIIAKCEGVGYARITQFMLHLMDRCVCLNTLDVFRSICTMDYDGLKAILLATSQHDLQQTLQKFSVCGRKEIKFACKQFMDIQRSFWLDSTSSQSAAETEETDAPQLS